MSDTVIAAIVGAIAGVITGSVSSLVAPWANWGIEKRKQKLTYQRELISKWRIMIASAQEKYNKKLAERDMTLSEILESEPDYYSLKPHLSSKVLKELYEDNNKEGLIMVEVGDRILLNPIDFLIAHLVDEVARIEKDWKLV